MRTISGEPSLNCGNQPEAVKKALDNLQVAEVTHVFATGPAQELEAYLKDRVAKLTFIGHPFKYASDNRSFMRKYDIGVITGEKRSPRWHLPQTLLYAKDILYTLFWLLTTGERSDIYFGVDVLNASVGLVLKWLGKVRRVILYTIDYHPRRFGNRLLNMGYHYLDRFCLSHCYLVWNLSPLMAKAREESGIKKDKSTPQIVVPLGVNFSRIERLPLAEIKRHNLTYMGHLRKNQGIDLIIEAMPQIINKINDARLVIIGTGELETMLRNMVKEFHLTESVDFTGYVESHQKVEEILSSCAVGIAPYVPDSRSYTYYADPGKPKQYMACGLPVIITRVPWIADEIEKAPMGIAINYDKNELAEAVVRLLQDGEFYIRCRENAINFAAGLEQEKIFDRAFAQTLGKLT